MHDDRLAEIKEALDKASPGPWLAKVGQNLSGKDVWAIWSGTDRIAEYINDQDIDLLANAPKYIRDCLAEIDYWRTHAKDIEVAYKAELNRIYEHGFRMGAYAQHDERADDV